MAAPAFVQAGSGVAITTGTGTCTIAGCTAGNLIIMQVYEDGVADDLGRSNIVNVEMLDGTDGDMNNLLTFGQVGGPKTGALFIYMGRVIANGTCSQDFTVGASSDDLFARAYEFSGESAGTTVATVCENGGSTWGGSADTGTSVGAQSVVTNGPDRLALTFVFIDDDQAIGSFTGETGGDWTEVVAEFASATGTQACLQLQSAAMPSAGTISGGSATIGVSSGWGSIGTALIGMGSDPTATSLPRRGMGLAA
jgi:hypothetical protein